MKLIACALPLLAGVPSVLSAQLNFSLPRLSTPAVPQLRSIAVVATLGGRGVTVRATVAGANATLRPRGFPGQPARAPPACSPPAIGISASGTSMAVPSRLSASTAPDSSSTSLGATRQPAPHFRQQATAGRALPRTRTALMPGDLMLFSSKGRGVDHVAIYAGDNRIIHSSAGAGGVVYDDLSTPRGKWYLARHVASRRVL